ncbi:hypothetical protein M231_02022 [Tremella mesenterica]|uniref:Uncharacterized protein n=1 Tax=Tremella mesenterica TaxID=5217 RepID=A0A4Q1BS58_TREME|nr:hypothetical protein M231_02022 [Tremella mesenterica]
MVSIPDNLDKKDDYKDVQARAENAVPSRKFPKLASLSSKTPPRRASEPNTSTPSIGESSQDDQRSWRKGSIGALGASVSTLLPGRNSPSASTSSSSPKHTPPLGYKALNALKAFKFGGTNDLKSSQDSSTLFTEQSHNSTPGTTQVTIPSRAPSPTSSIGPGTNTMEADLVQDVKSLSNTSNRNSSTLYPRSSFVPASPVTSIDLSEFSVLRNNHSNANLLQAAGLLDDNESMGRNTPTGERSLPAAQDQSTE